VELIRHLSPFIASLIVLLIKIAAAAMTLITAKAAGIKPRLDQTYLLETLFWATASLVTSAVVRVMADQMCFATRLPRSTNPHWWRVDQWLLVFMFGVALFVSGLITQFPASFSTTTGLVAVGSSYALLPTYLIIGYLYLKAPQLIEFADERLSFRSRT
jgi:hypothetical protein